MPLWKDKLEVEVEEVELRGQALLSEISPLVRFGLVAAILLIVPGLFVTRYLSNHYYSGKYSSLLLAAKRSFAEAAAPVVSKTELTSNGSAVYAAATKVQNPNVDLTLATAAYEVRFKTGSSVLYTYRGTLSLLPNETKYIVVPRVAPGGAVSSAELVFPEPLMWQKRLSVPKVPLTAAQPQLYEQQDPPAFVVEGSFMNSSAYLLRQVRVVILLYGSGNRLIASSQRDEFTVRPGERRAFKHLWPSLSGQGVVRAVVVPETNVLDPDNLQTVGGTGGGGLDRPSTEPVYE